MPGCKDKCYLFWEEHSLNNVKSPERQIYIEKELQKASHGEESDVSCLKDLISYRCLGRFLKDTNNLPQSCRHYQELPEDLTNPERLEILYKKSTRIWTPITTIVAIISVVVAIVLGYLNYAKSSDKELEKKLGNQQNLIVTLEKKIEEKDKLILQLKNEPKGGPKENEQKRDN